MSHSASPREWYRTASRTPRSFSPSARALAALAGPWRNSGGPGLSLAHRASSSGGASRRASWSQTARSHRWRSESGTPSCSAQDAARRATRWMCSSRFGETTAHSGRVGLSSALTKALSQTDVVDQSSTSHPSSDRHDRAGIYGNYWSQTLRLYNGNVLHLHAGLGPELLSHPGLDPV